MHELNHPPQKKEQRAGAQSHKRPLRAQRLNGILAVRAQAQRVHRMHAGAPEQISEQRGLGRRQRGVLAPGPRADLAQDLVWRKPESAASSGSLTWSKTLSLAPPPNRPFFLLGVVGLAGASPLLTSFADIVANLVPFSTRQAVNRETGCWLPGSRRVRD